MNKNSRMLLNLASKGKHDLKEAAKSV